MNEQANVELIKSCYADFLKGDIPAVLSHFAQDIDWEIPAIESAPFTGKREGLNQVAGFFQEMSAAQDMRDFRPLEFIAQGDRVVVLGHYEWTVKATGADYGSDWTHVFTIQNGKITKFKEYADTQKAAMAYQSRGDQAALGAAAGTGGERPAVH